MKRMTTSQNTLLDQVKTSAADIFGLKESDLSNLTWRVLSLLNVYRMLVAATVLALFFFSPIPSQLGSQEPRLFLSACIGYLVFGLIGMVLVQRRWATREMHVFVQLAVDILAISTMTFASGGVRSGLGTLLIVPVGAYSLTVGGRTPFFFAALASLAILFQQVLIQLTGTAENYTAAGILGGIIFIIALAAQPVARRLQESEALARRIGVDLANLSELNEYVVQRLRESIVVVDANNRIRLMNESAAQQLGVTEDQTGRHLSQVSHKLFNLLEEWRWQTGQPSALMAADGSTWLDLHFVPLGEDRFGAMLIFLEDTSVLAARVQQSKLASLGRLSASIAHEIRNPVGAISHAGQLLAESAAMRPEDKRLTEIIHTNSARISTIVENVLQLSRRDSSHPQRFLLRDWALGFIEEFSRTLELEEGQLSLIEEQKDVEVRMDPTHLHQVVWNLCDNSVKYASETAGGIAVDLVIGRTRATRRPCLEVCDRGSGIEADKVERVFEPFFTNARGGTGLGLYISRELCELNRATLTYHDREGGGSLFRIVFSDPKRWEADDE